MAAAFRRRIGIVLVSVLTVSLAAQAPPRALTIDAIYDPATRVDFSGAPPTNITWLDADSYLAVAARRTAASNG